MFGHVPELAVEAPPPLPIPKLKSLRYPGEHWRFWLAAVASVAILALIVAALAAAGSGALLKVVFGIAVAVGSLWLAMQVLRARLLGNSVKVTPASFPELHRLVEELRTQLAYRRRIDVYVADKSDPAVNLITYLGTHIIMIEGGLASELLEPAKQRQLRFLLARHIGALKTRQFRLDVLIIALNAANGLQFVKPFLLPYYRATAYSGDQIGMACCGDVGAALEATGRLLVGKELAARLPLGGVLPQAALVRRRWLPRLAQFISPTPHVINRYVNLLMFARVTATDACHELCAHLEPTAAADLDRLWRRSPHRRRAAAPGLVVPTATPGPAATPPSPQPVARLASFPPPSAADRRGDSRLDFPPPAPVPPVSGATS